MKSLYYILLFLGLPLWLSAQTSGQNYMVGTVPNQAVSDPATLNDANSNTTIQYMDGLGRPVETVQKDITPGGKDLVKLTEYDAFGREYRHWLPAAASVATGDYIPAASFINTANSFYSTLTSDSNPYAETILESSPLSRPLGQKSPGAAWNTHPTGVSYQADAGEVAHFYVNSNNQLQRQGNYTANTLYKTVVTDEDGKIATEYKDKQGQVVMKRSSSNVDTYYVYNDLGQLAYVLPPNAVDLMTSDGIFDDNGTDALTKFAYLYQYDELGNNVVKRLPGCDYIYMVYDKAQRLVMSQDGNQRVKNNWIVTKYDVLGRVLYTGLLSSTQNRVYYKGIVNNQVITETFDGSTTFYNTGYTCTGSLTGLVPLTVNYYDNYNFLSSSLLPTFGNFTWVAPPTGYDGQYIDNTTGQPNPKGLLTGTRTYILDKNISNYLTTALYYDKYGRVVQSRASNHLGGYDNMYNHYDFSGKVLTARKEHNISGQAVIPEVYTYTYDKAERLLTTTYQLNNKTAITLGSNTYDELGRLSTNNRHNQTDIQSYAYNIRNWATQIKSGTFEEDLYYNNNLPTGATTCFNGNIAYSTWTSSGVNKGYAYTYDDMNRLTLASSKQGTSSQADGNFNEQFTFDKQGNITALQRKKDNTLIDNLALNYTGGGNQVQSVYDAAGSQNQAAVKEYQNISVATNVTEFFYDKNGNMTTDLDRNIVSIRYNILNLPDTIQFSTGNQIINRYAADGRKLGTEYFTRVTNLAVPLITGQVISQTYTINTINQNGTAYIDNKEYNTFNGNSTLTALQRIYNAQGYAENVTATTPNYNYYRHDHLGNNREVWLANTNTTVQRTQYYASGLPWASNSGDNPGLQERKYNGKEFIEMNGYDTYDYGARGYYPALGRFMTRDPLCEMKPWQSPYMYCSGNPINRTDPTGMVDGIPDQTIPEVTVTGHNGSKNNSNSSPSVQFTDNTNIINQQMPVITPPTPAFNLPVTNNQSTTGNQKVPKNKELADKLKKVEALIKSLGITDGSVQVVEKIVNGTPTIVVLFKDGAAFANLANVLSKFKGAIGPVGFGLNEFADFLKLTSGTMNGQGFLTDLVINGVSVTVPEVGVVWLFLQSVSAENYPTNLPYYQNPVCPVDNTNVIIPNLKH